MDMIEELFETGIIRNFMGERKHKDGRIIQIEASHVAAEKSGRLHCRKCFIDQGYNRQEEDLRSSCGSRRRWRPSAPLPAASPMISTIFWPRSWGIRSFPKDLAKGNGVLEKNLSQVLKSVDRAKSLVRQILSFSRKTESEVKPLHMHLVIKEALKLLRASLPSTISIRSDIDDTDDVVVADATEMYQIVMNLCTNAAYAMKPDRGRHRGDIKAC